MALSGKVERGSSVGIANRSTRRIPGFVDVVSAHGFAHHDRQAPRSPGKETS